MPDLVDRIRAELEARIRELRPLVHELERLERVAAALARTGARSVPGLRSRAGASPSARSTAPRAGRSAAGKRAARPSPAKPRAPRATRARRKAAPRGQTQAKVLEALAAAPGSSTAAVAEVAGISSNVAGATISRLVKQGRVRRLDEGGYVVLETPVGEPPEVPPAASSDEGTPAEDSSGEPSPEPPPSGARE
jgi:hypothetical protein